MHFIKGFYNGVSYHYVHNDSLDIKVSLYAKGMIGVKIFPCIALRQYLPFYVKAQCMTMMIKYLPFLKLIHEPLSNSVLPNVGGSELVFMRAPYILEK